MNTIYIFGNPLLTFDNLPIRLKPKLEKAFPDINFIIQDPNENLHPENGELFIIDTVEGIKDVILIEDLDQIKNDPKYSMHDFDLGFNLKLLKKIGALQKVKIIGVPMEMNEKTALKKINQLLQKYKSDFVLNNHGVWGRN